MMMKWKIKNVWHRIEARLIKIKYFFQRGRKGYCDYDLYAFDDWLTEMMPRALREFKDKTHGWPDSEFKTFGEWQDCIERMAVVCERGNPSYWIDKLPDEYSHKELVECYQNSYNNWSMFCDMLKKYGPHLWD